MKLEPLNLWLEAAELNALAQRAVEERAELDSLELSTCNEGIDLRAGLRLPRRMPMLPEVFPVRARVQVVVREEELELGLGELELEMDGMLSSMAKGMIDSQRGKLLDQLAERLSSIVPVSRKNDSLLFSWRKLLQERLPGLVIHELGLQLNSAGVAIQLRGEGDLLKLLDRVRKG